jgi:hypothetical protein
MLIHSTSIQLILGDIDLFYILVKELDRALHCKPKAVGNVVVVAWITVKLGRLAGRSDLPVQGFGKLKGHFAVARAVMKLNRAGQIVQVRIGEIEAQNCGFCSGVPYCRIKSSRQRRDPPEDGWRHWLNRSEYDATTPAQITPALMSLLTTIAAM